ESKDNPTSWVLELLRGSYLLQWISTHGTEALGQLSERVSVAGTDFAQTLSGRTPTPIKVFLRIALWTIAVAAAVWLALDAFDIAREIRTDMSGREMLRVVWLGVLTFLRVCAMSLIATLVWTPIGVWIGLRPRIARIAQPLAQIAASFPINMVF